ncbi:DMT family transporter [Bacillus spongiae]|uniref:DMT family transporter n=1 Tax=Bacillus spongiae TaxID=2683610 RepID=A0ABU8HCQ3_9BACI
MMIGILFAIVAGSFVSLQNIFNSKVNEKVGSWSTTTFVLGLGFLASLTMGVLFEGKRFFLLQNMEPWYWLSGLIGVGVVSCLVQGIRLLGPTYAISIVLISQLVFALLLDSMGWLGLERIPLTPSQLIGALFIVCGIMVFKLVGKKEHQEAVNLS